MKLPITLLFLISALSLQASRIKDITTIEGDRDNQLFGYGLVVGLAGTGDSTSNRATLESVANALQRFGIDVRTVDVKAKNVAAVMVTCDIAPNMKEGARIDVAVSSMGDALTIQGGILLQTPLRAADGTVYAVAQGSVGVGGFLAGVDGASVQKNHPTVGLIPSGAIVEREIPSKIFDKDSLNLVLQNPDYTTAVRMADAINMEFPGTAQALDRTSVNVMIPREYRGQEINYIAQLTRIEVVPDMRAKIVINERTGTIIATQNVRISKVAISHGPLTVTVSKTNEVSQPNSFAPGDNSRRRPLGPINGARPGAGNASTNGGINNTPGGATFGAGGQTVLFDNAETAVTESQGGFQVIDDLPTIDRLTSALNALGVSTREMMSIFQSLKAAGALQAELVME